MEVLVWLEATSIGTWVRESTSLLAFPFILFLHTIGLSIVVGLSVVVDLRALGLATRLPLAPLLRYYPLMWIGFWINAASGVLLLMAHATTQGANPLFYVKMACIALAAITTRQLSRKVLRNPTLADSSKPFGTALAAASLISWLGATTAGRLLAYIGGPAF